MCTLVVDPVTEMPNTQDAAEDDLGDQMHLHIMIMNKAERERRSGRPDEGLWKKQYNDYMAKVRTILEISSHCISFHRRGILVANCLGLMLAVVG